MDIKGFNQFQDEIHIIDTNLSDQLEETDIALAKNLPDLKRGQRISFDHPRFVELRRQYRQYLQKKT